MDAYALAEVMGSPLDLARYRDLLPAYLNAARAAGITTVDRAAMWAAQLGHESAGLVHMNEIWGPTAAQRTYDGRMGNRTGTSDWSDFRGRGPIQLTGRDNYAAFTRWAQAEGHTSLDFTAQPQLVAQPHWGFLAAAWYWTVARPQINSLADRRDLEGVTRAINGGLNGLDDRRRRYNHALTMGARLMGGPVAEKVLDYPRDQVHQDTFYNCGPASVQTILRAATGEYVTEAMLGQELGTHTGGTDYIGQFVPVLNRRLPGGAWRYRAMPNDPPTAAQKDRLWADITGSIKAGFGVVANIVAPPSNYPRAVPPSTLSPAYSGGTVYHYIAVMGYSDNGDRRYWIADSGFNPFGYWISHDQLATLIPPKGYAYSTATREDTTMGFNDEDRRMLREVHRELTQLLPSRSAYRHTEEPIDTLAGLVINTDARIHESWVHERAAEAGMDPADWAAKNLGGHQ